MQPHAPHQRIEIPIIQRQVDPSILVVNKRLHVIGSSEVGSAAVFVIVVKLKHGCTMRAKLFTRFPS